MAHRRSAANSSARAKARTLVADTPRPFCRSLAGLVELVGGKARHGSQRDAEAITGKRYGEFPDGQLRTLQRRVRVSRMRIVQQLVYGADAAAEPNKDPGI